MGGRFTRLVLFGIALLCAMPVQAQVTYTYTGTPFTTADPPWMVGDSVNGSFTITDPLPPFQPLTDISSQLLDFSFSDGVQTRTPANSTVCKFEFATDGAGNITHWSFFLRALPTPPMGSPHRTLDSSGPGFGFGADTVGDGPAGSGPCDQLLLTIAATSSAPGSWVSTAPPVADPTDYHYTGMPFDMADPPWMVGDRVTGFISFAGPLPRFMPLTDVTLALDDFSFSDGVQTRTPANSTLCKFELSTDGAGNIKRWSFFLRALPTPPMGDPHRTLDSSGSVGGIGTDIVGDGPAGPGPCNEFVLTIGASSLSPGSWVSSSPPLVNSAEYAYTGVPFDFADPPWTVGDRVTGEISLAGPLPASFPIMDITFALEDFRFEDGVQTRTPANTTVCQFEVGTNAQGEIVYWALYLREEPFPGAGMTQRTLDSYSDSFTNDLVGEGPADTTTCGQIVLTLAATSPADGSWMRQFVPGRAIFLVGKDFSDGNTAEVAVTLSCNTGLPLQQTTTIAEGDPVTFVITDFEDGALNCEVTEMVPDGYTASYDNGSTVSPDGCAYNGIGGPATPDNVCVITNSLDQVEVEVSKVWIDDNPQFQAQNVADANWSCSNASIDGGPLNGNATGSLAFFGNPASDAFLVYPDWDSGTTCEVTEVGLTDSGIEVDDSDCQGLTLLPGAGASCTIFNTRLYEGIPTMNAYGLAVLVLLMLGMGLVAFRRFA